MSFALGFRLNKIDTYTHYNSVDGSHAIFCFYHDNILIFRTNLDVINNAKSFLSSNFDTKDLDKTNMILVIKITKH